MRRGLSDFARGYDAVLIDTDDSTGKVARLAAYAGGWAITPTNAETMATENVGQQIAFLMQFARGMEHKQLRHVGVLCTKYSRIASRAQGQALAELKAKLDTMVTPMPEVAGLFTIPALPQVTFGTLLPQVIPQLSVVSDAAKGRRPFGINARSRAVMVLYAQAALTLLHLTHPEKAAELAAGFADRPLPGVWPLPGTPDTFKAPPTELEVSA